MSAFIRLPQSLSWLRNAAERARLSRRWYGWLLAVWYTCCSLGIPWALAPSGVGGCSRQAGAECRCALVQRVRGTCCCSRVGKPDEPASCCSQSDLAGGARQQVTARCCGKSSGTAESVSNRGGQRDAKAVVAKRHEGRAPVLLPCPCGSETEAGLAGQPQPRLPATLLTMALSDAAEACHDAPILRWLSLRRPPPVPPPEVVS